MTIQEIKTFLDNIEISDLNPSYSLGASGVTSIADWQYEGIVKRNILDNEQTRGFIAPIRKVTIHSGVIDSLSVYLKDFLKGYLVGVRNCNVITAAGEIQIKVLSRSLIDVKIATGSDRAIESLQELVNDSNLEYNFCELLDGINVSRDTNFGDFVLSPTNTSFDILPKEIFQTVGNELIIRRSIIKFHKQYKTNLYLPEWMDGDSYSEKMSKMSKDDIHKFHTPMYEQGYLIYNVDDVFFNKRNSNYYIDILCYVLSVHFQKSILNTWAFICPQNILLRTCLDFMNINGHLGLYNMNNLTVGMTNPIEISDKDIQDINHFYQKMDKLCEEDEHKDRFIKSIWHYNNIVRSSDDVLRSQELVNAFVCLVMKVKGKDDLKQILEKHVAGFIATNDEQNIRNNLRKLRHYRNAQPHPHAKKLEFTVDGICESTWQNCLRYYKRLILKCIQKNGLCPS